MNLRRKLLLIIIFFLVSVFIIPISQIELFDLYQKYKSGNLSAEEMQKLEQLKGQYMGSSSLSLQEDKTRKKLPEEKDTKEKNPVEREKKFDLSEISEAFGIDEEKLREDLSAKEKKERKSQYYYQNYYFNKNKTIYEIDVSSLKRYGYDIFESPSTYAQVENVSVSDNYIIGPGDRLKINIWGGVTNEYELTVDKDGNLATPDFGTIAVAGLTYEKMKKKLNNIISSESDVSVAISK